MKNKIALTFATLTLTVGLLLSVAAQNSGKQREAQPKNPPVAVQAPIKLRTPIRCKQAGSGDVKAKILAVNDTGHTVKQGAVIRFKTDKGTTGAFTLTADLPAGTEQYLGKEELVTYTCTAYFIRN